MTLAAKTIVRGACPGVLRPMESGDGLIVRVRPRAATLTLDQVHTLAEAARRFGNGHIDLTRRANLQIRGVTTASLPRLHAVIESLGLLDATAEAEAVRNILVSPLAGLDPNETLDVRPIARQLEGLIAADATAWRLPPKFAFLIDGGGILRLSRERADIRLEARNVEGRAVIAVGIDGPEGFRWLDAMKPEHAPGAAIELAKSNPRPSPSSRRRPESTMHSHERAEASGDPDFPGDDISVGGVAHDGRMFAVGVAMPFGRVEADTLIELTDAAATAGANEIRLSPWRILYVPVHDEHGAGRFLDAASTLGFIVDPADPMLRVEACPGAPACRSAALDTRAAARAIARFLPRLGGIRSVHVSGCAKGCARSTAADLVLVGSRDGFGLVRHGRADGSLEGRIRPDELLRLPVILADLKREPPHA